MTRQEIITEAREWLSTPFHHHARLKRYGVDCVGLVIGLCQHFGIGYEDPLYDSKGRGADLLGILRRCLIETDYGQLGDILVFWIRNPDFPCHIGIIGMDELTKETTIIHTHQGIGKVCEHRYSPEWQRRNVAAFRLPGVTD